VAVLAVILGAIGFAQDRIYGTVVLKTPCVTPSVAVDNAVITLGQSVTVTAIATNNCNGTKHVSVIMRATADCGGTATEQVLLIVSDVTLSGKASATFTTQFTPSCVAIWTVTAEICNGAVCPFKTTTIETQ